MGPIYHRLQCFLAKAELARAEVTGSSWKACCAPRIAGVEVAPWDAATMVIRKRDWEAALPSARACCSGPTRLRRHGRGAEPAKAAASSAGMAARLRAGKPTLPPAPPSQSQRCWGSRAGQGNRRGSPCLHRRGPPRQGAAAEMPEMTARRQKSVAERRRRAQAVGKKFGKPPLDQ